MSDTGCALLRLEAHEVFRIALLPLLRKSFFVHAVLRAGILSANTDLPFSTLEIVTHKAVDTFSIGSVVATQSIVHFFFFFFSRLILV